MEPLTHAGVTRISLLTLIGYYIMHLVGLVMTSGALYLVVLAPEPQRDTVMGLIAAATGLLLIYLSGGTVYGKKVFRHKR